MFQYNLGLHKFAGYYFVYIIILITFSTIMKNKVIVNDSSEEESDSPLPDLSKKAKLNQSKKNLAKPVKKIQPQVDSDSEEQVPIVAPSKKDAKKAKQQSKIAVKKVPKKKQTSSEEESSEEVKPKMRKPSKEVAPKKVKKVVKPVSSEEESEEQVKPKKVQPRKASKEVKKPVKKVAVSSSEEESEEQVKPRKQVKAIKKKPVSSDEESESEKPKIVVQGRKVSKQIKAKPIQNDDSDEEESEEKPKVQKRKASGDKLKNKAKPVVEEMEAEEEEETGEFEIKVAGLSFHAYDDDVKSFFEQCGEIINVHLLKKPDGSPKGLGFIKFSKKSAFNKALELNGAEHMGRSLNIEESYGKGGNNNSQGNNSWGNNKPQAGNNRRDQPQGQANIETPTLFIGGLSYQSTVDSIKEFFSACGEVQSARITTDRETGNPRGFGYVEFFDVDTAKKAYQELNGQYLDGRSVRLDAATQRDRPPREGGFGGQRGGGFGGGGQRGGGFGGGQRDGGFGGPRANSSVALSQDDKNAKKGSIGGFAGKKMAL